MSFDTGTNSPALDPSNRGLAGIPTVPVWDPFGQKHMVRKDNANDLCNHGTYVEIDGVNVLRKWSMADPNVLRNQVVRNQVVLMPGGEVAADVTEAAVKNAKLETLREMAEAFGIAVDKRWGIKALTEEIAKFKVVPKGQDSGAEA